MLKSRYNVMLKSCFTVCWGRVGGGGVLEKRSNIWNPGYNTEFACYSTVHVMLGGKCYI